MCLIVLGCRRQNPTTPVISSHVMARYVFAMQKAEDSLIDYLASDKTFQSAQPYKTFNLPYAEFSSPFPSPPNSYAPGESSALCPSFISSLCCSPSTVVPTRLGRLKFTEPPKHIWRTGILNDSQRKSLGVSIRPQYANTSPMTSIVYDGVASGDGDLFQGQKFWIALRLPLRELLVSNVKVNTQSLKCGKIH